MPTPKMAIEVIEKVIKDIENELNITLRKLPRKKIMFDGTTAKGQSVVLISPSAKLHPQGCGWVDITKIQRNLALTYHSALIAFRLPEQNTYFVNFKQLSKYLSDEAMMNNRREGDHWKLYIWPDSIQIRKCQEKLIVKPNQLKEVTVTLLNET